MTQLFVDPQLEDVFVEHDFKHAAASPEAAQAVVDDYANERLILLRGLDFDADLDFLRSVSFQQKWRWKKLILSRFNGVPADARRKDPEIAEFAQDVFQGDWGRLDYFLKQSVKIHDRIRDAMDRLFAAYRFEAKHVVWRFTETRVENLHFDVDKNCDGLELIRLYVNLDDIPRMWYTAGTFSATARDWYQKLDLGRFRGRPADELLEMLDRGAFGDWHVRGRDRSPRHLVLFEPGDVWLVDGRRVSHQVMYGRRVVSTLYVAAPDGVPDPSRTFARCVDDLHRRAEAGTLQPRPVVLPPDPAGPASTETLNLRASWESQPQHIHQGRLLRF